MKAAGRSFTSMSAYPSTQILASKERIMDSVPDASPVGKAAIAVEALLSCVVSAGPLK